MNSADQGQISVSVPEVVPDGTGNLAKYWSEWQDLNLRPPRPERGVFGRAMKRLALLAHRNTLHSLPPSLMHPNPNTHVQLSYQPSLAFFIMQRPRYVGACPPTSSPQRQPADQ